MKRPIKPSEIRQGDLIRWEAGDNLPYPGYAAVEITADRDGMGMSNVGQHYLLDRPTPPVQLPEKPTLGWVTSPSRGGVDLDFWRYRGPGDRAGEGAWAGIDPDGTPRGYGMKNITAFVPATAVPAEALDELRNAAAEWSLLDPNSIVGKFLAAVDAAGAAS